MRRWSCGGWLTLSSFGRIFWNFHHGGRWIVPLNVCCGHACSWRGLNLRHYHEWFVSRIIVALRRSKKWCNSLIVELVANSSAYEDDVFFFKSLNVNVLHTLAGTRGLAANVGLSSDALGGLSGWRCGGRHRLCPCVGLFWSFIVEVDQGHMIYRLIPTES